MPRINPFEHGLTPEDLGMKRPQEKAVEAALRHAEATSPNMQLSAKISSGRAKSSVRTSWAPNR